MGQGIADGRVLTGYNYVVKSSRIHVTNKRATITLCNTTPKRHWSVSEDSLYVLMTTKNNGQLYCEKCLKRIRQMSSDEVEEWQKTH